MNSADNNRPAPRLALVCPCYNEEEALPGSLDTLTALLDRMEREGLTAPESFILIVNDGSRDRSWHILRKAHLSDPDRVKAVSFSRNAGHQNAILAGMAEAAPMADAVVTLDVDLQDDLDAIPTMVKDYMEGYDVVYGVKTSRTADPFLKRFTATSFYRLQKQMGVDIIYNHADFRLLSRKVVEELERYGERNMYIRGIVPMITSNSTTVEDPISERKAGVSKYTPKKMLMLAVDGITSFSVKPLFMILTVGMLLMLVSVGMAIYVFVSWLCGKAEHGWSSLMLSIWFVGGVLMMALGIVGLYIGRIFTEVKARPRYHIGERLL